ncbi:MAG: YbjQ family protein, partial [Sedimentisphaerales bacterium]|nr:YbjQ family protein [Sedimentisphaerales bacterium]
MANLIIQIGIPVFLIILGLIVGKQIEKKHLRSLDIKEQELKDVLVCNLRRLPAHLKAGECFLVVGSVVIATDYFKVFAAGLRNLFGGEMKTYRSLMKRA